MDKRLLVLAAFVGALSCTAPPEEAPEAHEVPAVEDSASESVDPLGNWARWSDTSALKQEALARLANVPRLDLGREATPSEIAEIDIDVMPDGTGLPEGSGTVSRGKTLYKNQCVQCHGEDGRGAEQEALVAPEPRKEFPFGGAAVRPITVGNFWPYAPTLYDYVYRAMPHAVPGSLPPDDVYSLVAYILYLNELLPEDATVDRHSLPQVEMPARDRFVYDDRAGGEQGR